MAYDESGKRIARILENGLLTNGLTSEQSIYKSPEHAKSAFEKDYYKSIYQE